MSTVSVQTDETQELFEMKKRVWECYIKICMCVTLCEDLTIWAELETEKHVLLDLFNQICKHISMLEENGLTLVKITEQTDEPTGYRSTSPEY